VHQLENTLYGVFVEIQQVRDSAVSEGRILLDHLFDRLSEPLLQHWLLA